MPVHLGEDWNATFFPPTKFNKFFLFTKKRAWGSPYPIICCILDNMACLQNGCRSNSRDCCMHLFDLIKMNWLWVVPVVQIVSVVIMGSPSSFHLPKRTSILFNLLWPLGCNKIFILLNKSELSALYVNFHVQATSDFEMQMACDVQVGIGLIFFRISSILGQSNKYFSF